MSNEENRDDAGSPQPVASSRLGKEAKIGVTVIVVLLIAFGAAVALRLKGLVGDNRVASAADAPGGSETIKGPSTTDALLKETKEKYFGNPSPTVVAAKAAMAEPPKTSVGDADQWKLAAERNVSPSAHGDSSVPRVPPSFMPDPAKASRAEQAEPHAFAPPAATDGRLSAFAAPAMKAEPPRLFEAPAAKPLADARRRDVAADRYAMASSEQPIKPISGQEPSLSGGSETSQPPAGALLLPPSRQSIRQSRRRCCRPPRLRPRPLRPPRRPRRRCPSPGRRPMITAASRPIPNTAAASRGAATPSYSAAPRRDDGKYEVQPNDTYWTISQKLYGTTAYFKALAHHNANMGTDEERLKPGELILAPPVAELEKAYPGLCPRPSRREAQQSQGQNRMSAVALRGPARGGRTYTVVEGDTLFNIARYELGKASRWAEIYESEPRRAGQGLQLSHPRHAVDPARRPEDRRDCPAAEWFIPAVTRHCITIDS